MFGLTWISGGLIAAMALAVGVQQWRVSNWQDAAYQAQQQAADLRTEVATLQESNAAMARSIDQQNEQIEQLQQRAAQLADQAALAAIQVELDAEPLHAAIDDSEAGPRQMNRFMGRLFRGPE